MSNYPPGVPEADETDREHLADVEDGCGCVEVWEALSEQRADDADGA